jgi:hypothetical protein
MKVNNIEQAIEAAKKFIEVAQETLDEQNKAPHQENWLTKTVENIYYFDIKEGNLHSGHLAANVKRKSMDLTRALSKMRNVK